MATTTSSPKLTLNDSSSFIESNYEAETSLTSETCGYCSKPKRPEKATVSPDMVHLCQCPNASDSTDPNIRLGTVPSSAFRRSPSPRPSLVPPATSSSATVSGGVGKLEIVSIREKHGLFRKAIPHMPVPLAVFLCLLNVVLPGSGTFISSFTVFCGCSTEHNDRRRSLLYNLLAALLQLLMAPVIVGWIWSVLWGITFVNISVSKVVNEPSDSTML